MKFKNERNEIIESNDPRLLIRETLLVEKLCQHGVGHPVGHLTTWNDSWMGVHGCDGCCFATDFEPRTT